MNLPAIIKLKTSVLLPSNEGSFNSEYTSARRKLRKLLKVDDMAKRMNSPYDILAEVKPATLIHARLNTFPYNLFESKFGIETEKIESKVEGKNHSKVSCILISKEYLINSYKEEKNFAVLQITNIKNLENFKNGKTVKFEEVSFFTQFIEICYHEPVIV